MKRIRAIELKMWVEHVAYLCGHPVNVHPFCSNQRLVSLSECRALYDGCSDTPETLTTENGVEIKYRLYCPCFDANGSNVGNMELAALVRLQS